MKTFKMLAFILFAFASSISLAQTSVFVCSSTGAYGFCYGNNNVSNCAKERCEGYGGKACYSIMNVQPKGHGAIAVGRTVKGDQVVGASAGYETPEGAAERALKECEARGSSNCSIENRFLDE